MAENLVEEFKAYRKKMSMLEQVVALFQWDMETLTPKNGLEGKVEAISQFSSEYFKMATAPEYGAMLDALAEPSEYEKLDEGMKVTVNRFRRDFKRNQRIPEDFQRELVAESARSTNVWKEAKQTNNFSLFEPYLDKMIKMAKQQAKYMEPDMDPYELLLDDSEEGMGTEQIDRLFNEVKEGLLPLLDKIKSSPKIDTMPVDKGTYPVYAQKELQEYLLKYIGFDFDSGAVAETEHPFTTTICRGDVRTTNHYFEKKLLSSIFTAIHEGGHAIYEQNVDPKYENTAIDRLNFMGLHESQSRFYENILGRNINFWKPIYGHTCELLPDLKDVSLEQFYRIINNVQPSMIRTEADEVTYCMHIILRYEMEKAIFRDNIPAKDLPEMWNQKMVELLGIRPANDREGILQDTHWAGVGFGYFPSYLLGSIFDGMYLEQLEKEMGSVDNILAEGRMMDITHWLNEKIHRNGSLYNSTQLIRNLCGKEISAKPLLKYFEEKYSRIYGF